jgi:predicted anti-sigma-YlaC factor YlaD
VFSCDDFRHGLSDLLDDEAARALRERLERHLAECRTCSVLYDSTRKTIRIVTDLGTWELGEDATRKLSAKILGAVRKG